MIGSQEPRLKIEPQRAETDGTDAALLMQEYGLKLDRWQGAVMDCWLGKDEDGNYTTTSAGLALPRQNGKNVCLEAREFYGLVVNGERILHTAHQVRTSKKSFRRLAAMFTDKRHPEILDIVKQIRYTNGEEQIELLNGGSIEFSARSRQAARGFDGISLVVFDEAQELTDEPGKHDAWHEWSVAAENINGIKVEDRTLWYNTNPALGLRLTEDFTEEELRSMSSDGFARERLGWWAPVYENKTDYALSAEDWDACKSSELKPDGKTAYGVKFTLDGAEVCLCGAVVDSDGIVRVSLIERRLTGQGTQWLADWLIERYKKASCVVIDGRNGVDVLIDKIAQTWRAKGSVIRPTAKQVVAAVSMLTDAVTEKKLTWYEKQEALRDSAINSTKRPIYGGWGFGGENAAPIEAAALALYGVKITKRDPNKKMRIG